MHDIRNMLQLYEIVMFIQYYYYYYYKYLKLFLPYLFLLITDRISHKIVPIYFQWIRLSLALLFWKIFSPSVHTYIFHLASAHPSPARCPRPVLSSRDNPWDRPRFAVSPWACESRRVPSPFLSPWKIHCTKAGQAHVLLHRVMIRGMARETCNWNIQRQWNGNRDAHEKGSSLFARASSISLEWGRVRCKYIYSYRETSSETLLLQRSQYFFFYGASKIESIHTTKDLIILLGITLLDKR